MAPVAPLASRFEDSATEEHGGVWSRLWDQLHTPWDRSQSSPALVELLDDDKVALFTDTNKIRTALVPGCGRGYDVLYLARALRRYTFERAVGLEISSGAVKAASHYFAEQLDPTVKGHASVLLGDFFDSTQAWSTRQKYDLVYDYTFLCALHPSRRQDWARRMVEVTTDDGVLITLQHPLHAKHEGGPPFSLTPEIYDDLLLPHFDKVYHQKPGRGFDLELSKNDMIAVYRRRQKHDDQEQAL